MTLELSRQKAAQAWCTPTTKHLTMVPELAFAFADILEEELNHAELGNQSGDHSDHKATPL